MSASIRWAPAPPPSCGRPRFIANAEFFARHEPAFAATAEDWDADPFLLGTPGGFVDLKTGQLGGSDPGKGVSRVTGVTPAGSAECPLWRRFLDETLGDEGLVDFVRTFFGYALTGTVSEQMLLFGHGSGGNGKSVLMNVVSRVLGDYARPATLASFSGAAADLAAHRGVRLVTVAETEDRAWDETRIKLLTGGDPIVTRTPLGPVTFTPSFKLFLTGNAPPTLRKIDPAMKRRLCLIPFAHVPERPDRDLEDKLMAEAPSILRWMIEGCLDWQARGLVRPPALLEATAAYFAAHDMIGQFLADACDCGPSDQPRYATTGGLYAAWTKWAREAGEPAGSQRRFSDALAARGFERVRTNSVRLFKGLSLRPTAESDGGDEW